MDEVSELRWVVLLPVKAVASSKSRLQPAFADPLRLAELVTAMRRDTVAALRDTPGVIAIVAAVDTASSAGDLGPGVEVVVQDEPGLNAALRAADTYAAGRFPHAGRIAVVGDLPSLTPAALRGVLDAAARHRRAFVPDLDGTGTTMLAVTAGPLEPAFGEGSAARHARAAEPLPAAAAARRDVDLPTDLDVADTDGLGRHTRAVLAEPAVSGCPRT